MLDERWPQQGMGRLQRLTAMLSQAMDLPATARAAVENATEALGANGGAVFVVSPNPEILEIPHAFGFCGTGETPLRLLPLAAPLPASDAVREGRPVLVANEEEIKKSYPALANRPGLRHGAIAAFPLMIEGNCFGSLLLSYADGQAFSAEEIGFLLLVADQCAQALHRALLTERERRAAARLRVLAEASRALAMANPDVKSVLEAIAAQILANVGPTCVITLTSPDGEWLDRWVIRDVNPLAAARLDALRAAVRLRRNDGIVGSVVESGQTLFLPIIQPQELASRTVPAIGTGLEAMEIRSLLVVPIKTASRCIGVIASMRYAGSPPFSEDDRRLMEDMADRAALAIENARLHEAEREARERAEQADRRKDEFLGMLGHELRNPLAPIGMALEVMRQVPLEDERLLWARDVIGRQVDQMTRLVDDLMDVSRIALGKIELRREPVDLVAVARQAMEASRPLLAQRRHVVCVELPEHPIHVRGDGARLTQVISNLLSNAGKYTDPGGRVSLSIEVGASAVTVTVTDSGIGIPPAMLPRVFEPFAQAEPARLRSQGGIGIGLTLVKRLVEMHGGSVAAWSDGEGTGSMFAVRMPLLFEVARFQTATLTQSPLRRSLVRRRILVADDNVDAAESLRRVLALQSHEVEVVHNGLDALHAMERIDPDVALIDIDLPRLDGLEVARRVRAERGLERPMLVATTGHGRPEDRTMTLSAGFDHHLVKPIDLSALAALLDGKN